MEKQLVKWKGPPVDIGIGPRQEPDTNAWENEDDGEDNPDDWEDVTPVESDGWGSDNSDGTPEESVNDDSAYDSDDFVDDALAPAGLYLPDGTPRAVIVPDDVEDEYDLGLPDDFELRITPEMIRASRERRNEDIERTRMSREDRNSGESKEGESKEGDSNVVYTRPFKRMRNVRLRF